MTDARRPRNPPLMAAVGTYVWTAIEWLAHRDPPERPDSEEYHVWTRTGAHSFLRQRGSRARWLGLFKYEAALEQLPEYRRATTALEQDPIIGPQLNQLVGSVMSRGRVEAAGILRAALFRSLGDKLIFDESRFRDAYFDHEHELYSDTVSQITLAPVAGLAASPYIRFGRIELDRVSDAEAQLLLDAGVLQWSTGSEHVAWTNTDFVLRVRQDQPKTIGDPVDVDERALPGGPQVREALLEVLQALRILKNGRVAIPAMVISDGSGGRQWGSLAPVPSIRAPQYSLNEYEAADVALIWDHLRAPDVRRWGFLETAIRRFLYAGERDRVEDRFIDLMIAAEAMFLGEDGGGLAGELTQKISTRFAHFAPIPALSRQERFNFMKKAYGARSSIVHGDRPRGLKTPEALQQFTDQTADCLRVCLRAMMAWAKVTPASKPLIDWEELTLR